MALYSIGVVHTEIPFTGERERHLTTQLPNNARYDYYKRTKTGWRRTLKERAWQRRRHSDTNRLDVGVAPGGGRGFASNRGVLVAVPGPRR